MTKNPRHLSKRITPKFLAIAGLLAAATVTNAQTVFAAEKAHTEAATKAHATVSTPSKSRATASIPSKSHPTVAQEKASPPQAKAGGHDAIMHFPDRTMGQIFTVSPDWTPHNLLQHGKFVSLAKGTVKIPAGVPLYFEPNGSIDDHVEILNAFPPDSLRIIDLENCEVPDNLLKTIGKLHSLWALNLRGTDINDISLKMLTDMAGIQNIDLSRTLVNGTGLHYLSASKKLERIDLSWNAISPEIVNNLSCFPKLEVLLLARGQVKDSYLPGLAKVSTLQHLKLSQNNGVTDSGMRALLPLKHLTILEVADTNVSPAGLLQLKSLPIKSIWLSHRYNDRTAMGGLKKAFQVCSFTFDGEGAKDMPMEVFDPLH